MTKGISAEFKILIAVVSLLALLGLLLVMTLVPIELKIVAVIMKYLAVFIGSALLITVVFSRIVDGLLAKQKD